MNIFQELSKVTAVFYPFSVIFHNKEAVVIPVVKETFSGAHSWAESFKRISNENALIKPQVDDNPGFLNSQDIMLLNPFLYEKKLQHKSDLYRIFTVLHDYSPRACLGNFLKYICLESEYQLQHTNQHSLQAAAWNNQQSEFISCKHTIRISLQGYTRFLDMRMM